jgi:hypothetical protein
MSRIAARSDIGDAIARRADGGSAMRKLISFMVMTLDGFTEGPNGEFDWPNVDEEFTNSRSANSGNVLLTFEPQAR